jgi:hypothetical protein
MPVRRFLAGKSAGAELGTAPGAKIGERAGELAHRRLITDVLQFRRQAAEHCAPEPRADPIIISERKWRFASSSAYGRKADIRRNADVG